MTKKLELKRGRGWFDGAGEEVEIVGLGTWTMRGRTTHNVGIQYVENKQIVMTLSEGEFRQLFRRKEDENNRH